MPYEIQKQGDQYCVYKKGSSERMGCHDSQMKAQRQIAALYASEKDYKPGYAFITMKEAGRRYMLLISSNAYKDREKEFVKEKAIDSYVAAFEPNPFKLWHGGDPIGEIIHAEKMGVFLVEVAQELPDAPIDLSRLKGEPPLLTTVKAAWDAIEYSIETQDVDWGASIGFGYIRGDKEENAYSEIKKLETSGLPVMAAANILTNMYLMKGANHG